MIVVMICCRVMGDWMGDNNSDSNFGWTVENKSVFDRELPTG